MNAIALPRCAVFAPPPAPDRKQLRGRILELLLERSAEAHTLANRLGLGLPAIMAELDVLAWCGLVDALEPPEPCGREHLRWFVDLRRAA